MGRNVFVSYKYGDYNVHQFKNSNHKTSSRDYVNVIMEILEETEFYYFNGEYDNEDLKGYPEEFIRKTLYDKIFYTSITIILITPNMRRLNRFENDQWIPREISYSLRNKSRECGDSKMNAVLCIIIPDRTGNYNHALRFDNRGNKIINEKNLFNIIKQNLFNNSKMKHSELKPGYGIYEEGGSYFSIATWDEFRNDPEYCLENAVCNRGHWKDYRVVKNINPKW